MKKILIAGGQCGITMLRAQNEIEDRAKDAGIEVSVKILDLWMSSYFYDGYTLIVEMFPYFEEQPCPVLDGRPFINRKDEEKLLGSIITLLRSSE